MPDDILILWRIGKEKFGAITAGILAIQVKGAVDKTKKNSKWLKGTFDRAAVNSQRCLLD